MMPECGEGLGMPWLRCFSAERGNLSGREGAEMDFRFREGMGRKPFFVGKIHGQRARFPFEHLRNDGGNFGNEVF